MNLYAYVCGDPVNYTDPWGLKSTRECNAYGCTVTTPSMVCHPDGTCDDTTSSRWEPNPGGTFDQFVDFFNRWLRPQAEAIVDPESYKDIVDDITSETLEIACGAARSLYNDPDFKNAMSSVGDGAVVGAMGVDAVVGGGGGLGVGVWAQPSTGDRGAFVFVKGSGGYDLDGYFSVGGTAEFPPSDGFGLTADLGIGPYDASGSVEINGHSRLSNPSGSGTFGVAPRAVSAALGVSYTRTISCGL